MEKEIYQLLEDLPQDCAQWSEEGGCTQVQEEEMILLFLMFIVNRERRDLEDME